MYTKPMNQTKDELRRKALQTIRAIPWEQRAQESKHISRQLQHYLIDYDVVAFFYPLPSELNILPLLKDYLSLATKTILLPKSNEKEGILTFHKISSLENIGTKHLGVVEPNTEQYRGNIDIILVPALAIDDQGNRLGRGAGYYDRTLPSYPNAELLGLCFSALHLKHIPHEAHDVVVKKLKVKD